MGFLLVFGPACFLIFIATRGCKHDFKQLENFGQLPGYTFTDARGKIRTFKEFKDEIVIITTLQKSCPYQCAISFWHVNQILYQHIRKNRHKQLKRVRIISFVTDGKGKEVAALGAFEQMLREQVEGYDPKLWVLAQGDAKSLFNITHNKQNLLQEGNHNSHQ